MQILKVNSFNTNLYLFLLKNKLPPIKSEDINKIVKIFIGIPSIINKIMLMQYIAPPTKIANKLCKIKFSLSFKGINPKKPVKPKYAIISTWIKILWESLFKKFSFI